MTICKKQEQCQAVFLLFVAEILYLRLNFEASNKVVTLMLVTWIGSPILSNWICMPDIKNNNPRLGRIVVVGSKYSILLPIIL